MAKGWFRRKKGKLVYSWYNSNGFGEALTHYLAYAKTGTGEFYGVNLRLLGDATSKKIETYIHQQTSGRLSVRKATKGKTAIRRTR